MGHALDYWIYSWMLHVLPFSMLEWYLHSLFLPFIVKYPSKSNWLFYCDYFVRFSSSIFSLFRFLFAFVIKENNYWICSINAQIKLSNWKKAGVSSWSSSRRINMQVHRVLERAPNLLLLRMSTACVIWQLVTCWELLWLLRLLWVLKLKKLWIRYFFFYIKCCYS